MYSVSPSYLAKISQDNRVFRAQIDIQPVVGEAFRIYDDDIVENSMILSEHAISGDTLGYGGAVAASFSVSFYNPDGKYDGIKFNGAQVNAYVGLATYPNMFEMVPLGVFIVDSVEHAIPFQSSPVNSIKLLAMDRLIMLERPFSEVGITFPCRADNLLIAVCAACGVTRASGATAFINSNYVIQAAPEGDYSCRDIVSYIAEMAASFVRFTRDGRMDFVWFKNPASSSLPDATLTPQGRIRFAIDDTPITLSGAAYETADGVIRAGNSVGEYDIQLSDNPLIAGNPISAIQDPGYRAAGFSYTPCSTDRHDDPALQAGDMVLHKDVNGVDYRSIITHYEYRLHGTCRIEAAGLSKAFAGWKSKLQKKVSTLERRVDQVEEGGVDFYADAVGLAFGMLAGVTGGHFIKGDDLSDPKYEGKFFLADNKNLALAKDIWQYSMGGIGHFTNGINSTPQSAWTADGRLVVPIVNANQIYTGTLISNNGSSWIDMLSGAGSFASGSLAWSSNGNLKANNIDINGGRIKIGSGTYYTLIEDGDIGQYMGSGNSLIGGLVPIGGGSTVYQTLYAANGRAGVVIGQQNSSGAIEGLAQFTRTGLTVNVPVKLNAQSANVLSMDAYGDLTLGASNQYGSTNIYAGTGYVRFFIGSKECAYVSTSGINNSSVATQKTDIQSAGSALDIVRNAQLYRYHYTEPPEESAAVGTQSAEHEKTKLSPERMGFVIGDGYEPPPDCVLAEDGRGVNLYSMTSLCWKAIQELSAQIAELKGGTPS